MKYIVILIISSFGFSQSKDFVYKQKTKSFYKLLYKNEVTIFEISSLYWQSNLYSDNSYFLQDSLKKEYSDIPFQLRNSREKKINIYKTSSFLFKKAKPYFNRLTLGLTHAEISKQIEKAIIFNDGLNFTDYLELTLKGNQKIYFQFTADMPTIIEDIWLNDGVLFDDLMNNEKSKEKLLLVGGINDKDGYVNIRETKFGKSKVVGRIKNNDFFYYIPNSENDWWEVSKEDNYRKTQGFVHKSRILNYTYLSTELKNKIKKSRN
jgi:hypothetical protein